MDLFGLRVRCHLQPVKPFKVERHILECLPDDATNELASLFSILCSMHALMLNVKEVSYEY